MQRAPKVGATVYTWEDDVSSFDPAEWQVKVFQPIDVALRDVSSAYGKRGGGGARCACDIGALACSRAAHSRVPGRGWVLFLIL